MNGRIIQRKRDDSLVPLCVPRTQVEAAIICSLLDSESIPHFVSNEFFGSLKVGPMIPHFNEKTVMVPRSSYQKALALIEDPTESEPETDEPRLSLFEKMRLTFEVVFFGWIMPRSLLRRRVGPTGPGK